MRRPATRGSAEYYLTSGDNALRSAARLGTAREAAQRRVQAVVSQRRLDRERQQQHDADRLWSMGRGTDSSSGLRP